MSADTWTAEDWDLFADEYFTNQQLTAAGSLLVPALQDWLVRARLLTTASRVLDLGAGSGRFTGTLASVARTVTALDFSREMLAYNRRVTSATNVTFVQSDWHGWSGVGSGRYDLVFAHMAPFLSVTDWGALTQTVRPGGWVVLSRIIGRQDDIGRIMAPVEALASPSLVDESVQWLVPWVQKSRRERVLRRQTVMRLQTVEQWTETEWATLTATLSPQAQARLRHGAPQMQEWPWRNRMRLVIAVQAWQRPYRSR